MKTKAKYEIELAASSDECREVITNIQLYKDNKCLVATDGKILAIVPVEVEDGEVNGPIPPQAFKSARKGITKKQKEIDDVEIDIHCLEGELNIYTKKEGVHNIKRPRDILYPNFKQVIPRNKAKHTIRFNPELLMKLAKAIGSSESIVLEFNDEDSPIEVYSCDKTNEAFGVLLPICNHNKIEDRPDNQATKNKYLT